MESTDSLQNQLKKVSRELFSNKIQLHQTTVFLQSILQNSNDLIFATDVDGILMSFSKGGEKALGYTWEELAGSFIKDLAADPLELEKLVKVSREEGSAVRLELPFRGKDGQTIHYDVSLINLTNTEGKTVGTVGICRDITLWKKLQEDLIQIDRLAEIGRIASGVAHEINNPLAIISEISGWAGVVVSDAKGLSQEDREELETAARRIGEQTDRCKAITHQLLGFARGSAPAIISFDIHAMIKKTIGFLEPQLKFKPIDIVLNFEDEALPIKSDPKMLEQVFVNLITNAIYAVKEKGTDQGRIDLKTSRAGPNMEIMISDNGTGIPEEAQKKIFDLFYTTKPSGKGTGLGIPICRNIIKKLGGEISVESQEGRGTTFNISIPVS
ncbi:MAG: PAS domain S-box protein [Deltaproteobacteria bacterium]|nr:PAS domain S-box protein [Deltaproteobacteria bacterium]